MLDRLIFLQYVEHPYTVDRHPAVIDRAHTTKFTPAVYFPAYPGNSAPAGPTCLIFAAAPKTELAAAWREMPREGVAIMAI
jgi:hypothetical protein